MARAKRGGAVCGLALVGFLMFALGLGVFLAPAGQALAQTSTTAAATTAAGTTAAGTSATSGSTINVFCLDFGKQFPTGQTITAKGLANDKIRAGLTYAISKGYITSQPYQVQMAVWQLQDGQPFHDLKNAGTTIAQEIVTNAGTAAAPQADASQVSNLTLTNVQETSPQSAYGTATVQGTINSQGLPVGFLLPASGSNFQNLVGVVSSGSAAQATTAAATTAAATTAAATTAAATTVAATTAAATTAAGTTVAATTAAATTAAPTTVAAATVGGQGGAPAAPASGFGGEAGNGSSALGLLSMLVGLTVLALAGFVGMQLVNRKNR
jgi:hypothetical protein